MKMRLYSFIALSLLLLTPFAHADSFRCPGGLILNGDSKYKVMEKCGPPDYIDYPFYSAAEQTWVYENSPQHYRYILTIPDVDVTNIRTESKRN